MDFKSAYETLAFAAGEDNVENMFIALAVNEQDATDEQKAIIAAAMLYSGSVKFPEQETHREIAKAVRDACDNIRKFGNVKGVSSEEIKATMDKMRHFI